MKEQDSAEIHDIVGGFPKFTLVKFTEKALLPVLSSPDYYVLRAENSIDCLAGFSVTLSFHFSLSPQINYGLFICSNDEEHTRLYVPEFLIIGLQRAPLKIIAHNTTPDKLVIYKGDPVAKFRVLLLSELSDFVNTNADNSYIEKLGEKRQPDSKKKFKFTNSFDNCLGGNSK